jgi:hypothetical protein
MPAFAGRRHYFQLSWHGFRDYVTPADYFHYAIAASSAISDDDDDMPLYAERQPYYG